MGEKTWNISHSQHAHSARGFQSNGGGHSFWTNAENQKRFIALWTEIARRFADEPTIIGYGILNEPRHKSGTAIEEWQKIAQRTVDAIRDVDKNHIVIVERMMMFDGLFNKWAENTNGLMNFVPINDNNTMYEFHNYDPLFFTHQGADWLGFNEGPVYPDKIDRVKKLSRSGEKVINSAVATNITPGEWTYISGNAVMATDDKMKTAIPILSFENGDDESSIMFDDFELEEIDENGTIIQKHAMDLNTEYGWIKFGSHKDCVVSVAKSGGRDGNGVLYLNGGKNWRYEGYIHRLEVTKKHLYRLSGWIRCDTPLKSGKVAAQIGFYRNYLPVLPADRYGTGKILDQFLYVRNQFNVPVYLGEFGVIKFGLERGGYAWIKDLINECTTRNIHYNFHSYHDPYFGLFRIDFQELTSMDKIDNKHMDVFIETQKE